MVLLGLAVVQLRLPASGEEAVAKFTEETRFGNQELHACRDDTNVWENNERGTENRLLNRLCEMSL